ncbi:hypothetical protein ACNKHR_18050 [Shigella flexneri]
MAFIYTGFLDRTGDEMRSVMKAGRCCIKSDEIDAFNQSTGVMVFQYLLWAAR